MNIIIDNQSADTVSALDRAWREAPSFLILPGRYESGRGDFEQKLELLPEAYRSGHFVLLTSGSTGAPSLVVGEKKRSEGLAALLQEAQCNGPVRNAVLSLPLSYSFGLVNLWLWSRVNGAGLIFSRGFADPAAFSETLMRSPDVMLCLVRAQVRLLEEHYGRGRSFPTVVRVHFAGGRFPQESLDFLAALFPNARIFNNYGCVEAMPRLTVREASESDSAMNVGRPLEGVELEAGSDGVLRFKSPYAAVAAIGEEGFREIETGSLVATGDLGHQTADGSWVIDGRASEVFKRYGEKVSVAEVEAGARLAWGGEIASYREADPGGEEGYVMVCCPRPEKADVQNILRIFRKTFARAQWPLRLESVDELPLLPSGKPDTGRLRAGCGEHLILWRQMLR